MTPDTWHDELRERLTARREVPARDAPGRAWLGRALPALLVLGALFLLVLPALDPALQLYDRDTSRCEAPLKWEMWRRLAMHQLPLWVRWTEGGTSLLGQMTAGMFHPTSLLYLLPLPFELAFKLQHLLALPLAAAGLYALARGVGAGRFGAASGAVAYAGSGWVVSMAASNLHYALGAAAVPWALFGLLRFLDTRRPLWLLLGGWALSWPVVAGEPQSALFAGLLGGALALGADGRRRDDTSPYDHGLHANHWYTNLFARLGLTLLWALTALALSAPAALPVALRLRASTSAPGLGSSRGYFALPPWRVFGLALPTAFDETLETTPTEHASPYHELTTGLPVSPFAQGIALGAPALLLALFAPRRKRRWLLGGAGLCVLAAMGSRTPLDALLLRLVPPLGWFRFPEKWIAPATLLFSLAAALGAGALFEPGGEGDRAGRGFADAPSTSASPSLRPFIATALAGALLFALAAALLAGPLEARASAWIAARMRSHSTATALQFIGQLRAGLAEEAGLLAALSGLGWMQRRGRLGTMLGPALCVALLGVSALAASGALLYTMPIDELRGPVPIADELRAKGDERSGPLRIYSAPDDAAPPSSGDSRVAMTLWRIHALASDDNAFRGVENVASYSSLVDRDYEDLLARARPLARALFDVQFAVDLSWHLSAQEARAGAWQAMPLGLAVQQEPAKARAFLLACAYPLEREAAFARLEAGFDPRKVGLAREGDAEALGGLACPVARSDDGVRGDATWTRPSPEEIDVELDARAPALLVVAEHFDPGWTASIDGAPARPVLQIDRAALGAPVPAGHHRAVLKFVPQGLVAGLACALACLAILVALELRLRSRR